MIIMPLERYVEYPITLVSNTSAKELAFVAISYVCILLTIVQVIFTILGWVGKRRSLGERIYYSLATAAAAGYLLLLGSWGLIAALY